MTNNWHCYLVKLNNENCQNIKKTAPLFLFLEGQMHKNQSVCAYAYAAVLIKQYTCIRQY